MLHITDKYPNDVVSRAKDIKLIITDVDGVLTNGGIIYDNNGLEYKKFNVKDGQVIKLLKNAGILIGAITGRESEVVKFRLAELGFDFHYHGIKDKLGCYQKILQEYSLQNSEVAYLGDDIIDLPVLSACGLAICPSDSPSYIQPHVHWVSGHKGGSGVFREAADLILAAQNKFEEMLTLYLRNNHIQSVNQNS